jgi:hypothetical protein
MVCPGGFADSGEYVRDGLRERGSVHFLRPVAICGKGNPQSQQGLWSLTLSGRGQCLADASGFC